MFKRIVHKATHVFQKTKAQRLTPRPIQDVDDVTHNSIPVVSTVVYNVESDTLKPAQSDTLKPVILTQIHLFTDFQIDCMCIGLMVFTAICLKLMEN